MAIDIGNFFDFLGHLAPGAAQAYSAHERGEMDADAAFQEAQAKKRAEERQARIDQQQAALRALQIENQEAALKERQNPAPDMLEGTGGRQFPDTEEGRAAYEEWERRNNPGRFSGPVAPEIGYGARDWETYLDRRRQLEELFGSGGEPGGVPGLNFNQALGYIRDRYVVPDPSGGLGSVPYLSPEEEADLANRLMRGESLPPVADSMPRAPGSPVVGEGTVLPPAVALPPSRSATPATAPTRSPIPEPAPPIQTEAQREWDSLAQQFGAEVTMREIGPRP